MTSATRPTPLRPNRLPGVSEAEWELRTRLAGSYRIADYLGWSEAIYAHITVRLPGPEHHFLINPYGLRYDEVTASNLVKVELDGTIVGDSSYPVNPAGFIIHSAVHQAREDVRCVFHTHTTAGMAIAAQQQGLLPISIMASGFYGRVAYHDYEGPTMRPDEQERLVASLGANKVLILRNHGLLTTGATLEEAFINMFRLQRACEIQVAAQAGGAALTIPSESVCEDAARMADEFLEDTSGDDLGKPEFDAYLRLMDKLDPSYRD